MSEMYTPQKADKIAVEYHGELMDNIFMEETIDTSNGIKVVPYAEGLSMVFLMNKIKDNYIMKLYLQIDNGASGWIEHDLSQQNENVTAFEIYHDLTLNRLRISYASETNSVNKLRYSNYIDLSVVSSQTVNSDFNWHEVKLIDVKRKVDHVSVGSKGLLFSSSYKNEDATYSYLLYGNKPERYILPENSIHIHQLEVGNWRGEFGVFVLYDMKYDRTMIFHGIEDNDDGYEGTTLKFKPKVFNKLTNGKDVCEINGFSLVSDAKGNDHLYLCGEGIYKYPRDLNDKSGEENELRYTEICEKGDLTFKHMRVANNNGSRSIWAIGEEADTSGLYYITNRCYNMNATDTGCWTEPLQMQHAVDDFACMKGSIFENDLFLLGSEENDSTLIHFYQDKERSTWHEQPVVLPTQENILVRSTFTVNIQFSYEGLETKIFDKEIVRLKADTGMLVYINNKRLVLGPDKEIEVQIDQDCIEVVYPTDAISSGCIIVDADFLESPLKVDPSHKSQEKLYSTLCSENGLKEAKTQDGRQLIDIDKFKSNEIKEAVQALTIARDESSKMKSQDLNSMDCVSGGTMISSEAMPALALSFSFKSVTHAVGDIIHAAKKGFTKIGKMIISKVGEAVKFTIEIGGKVIDYVAKVVADIVNFVGAVLDKIGAAFKKMYDFLASLLNFNDIMKTKNVLKAYMNNLFIGVSNNIGSLQIATEKIFDEFENKVDDIKSGIHKEEIKASNVTMNSQNNGMAATDPRQTQMKSKTREMGGSTFKDKVNITTTNPELIAFLDAVNEVAKKSESFFKDLITDFKSLVKGEMEVVIFIKKFALNMLDIGLDIAKKIILLLLGAIKKIVTSTKDVLNAKVNVPIISSIYCFYTQKDLTLLDTVCFLLAVPYTCSYKLLNDNKAPFSDEKKGKQEEEAFVNSASEIFKNSLTLIDKI